ncbi:MAG TPA: glycoside hydrolase family protein [Polyangiaceae bacterium]|nr:glycoside hydrolase family protein [Polyangiaceae bacterium]
MQKEFLWRARARSALALGVVGAACVSACVTGQVVDGSGSSGETEVPSSGSSSVSMAGSTVAAAGSNATHPNGGAGGASGSAGHAGTTPQGGASGTTSISMGGASGSTAAGSGGVTSSAGAAAAGSAGMPATECSSKRGIAYAFDVTSANPDMSVLKAGVGWFYGWSNGPSANAKPAYPAMNMEFVPMVWGGGFNVANVEKQIPAGAKYLLGFNEPNFGASQGQSNLTPQQAASMWPQIQQIAADKNLQIVSPALNYCSGDCNQTDPFVWWDQFFAACTNCKVDYLAAHWYACTVNALEDYLTQLKKYNKPIWLTEFACADGGPYTPDQVKTYMLQATNYLEHDPDVFRYSWFTGRTDGIPNVNLLAASGQLTDLGTAYVNQLPARCP